MINASRFTQLSLTLSGFGFIVSLFFCAYALGLFQMEQFKEIEKMQKGELSLLNFSSYFPIYKDISFRLCLISICFLMVILVTWLTQNIFFKLINFLWLVIILLQSYISLSVKPASLTGLAGDIKIESAILFYYIDYLTLGVAILLTIFQVLSIWKAKPSKGFSAF